MNEEDVIKNMINYIEAEERNLQVAKLVNDSKSIKTDIVNSILTKLEEEMNHED